MKRQHALLLALLVIGLAWIILGKTEPHSANMLRPQSVVPPAAPYQETDVVQRQDSYLFSFRDKVSGEIISSGQVELISNEGNRYGCDEQISQATFSKGKSWGFILEDGIASYSEVSLSDAKPDANLVVRLPLYSSCQVHCFDSASGDEITDADISVILLTASDWQSTLIQEPTLLDQLQGGNGSVPVRLARLLGDDYSKQWVKRRNMGRLKPGTAILSVFHPEYGGQFLEVVILPGETKKVELSLIKRQEVFVKVQTANKENYSNLRPVLMVAIPPNGGDLGWGIEDRSHGMIAAEEHGILYRSIRISGEELGSSGMLRFVLPKAERCAFEVQGSQEYGFFPFLMSDLKPHSFEFNPLVLEIPERQSRPTIIFKDYTPGSDLQVVMLKPNDVPYWRQFPALPIPESGVVYAPWLHDLDEMVIRVEDVTDPTRPALCRYEDVSFFSETLPVYLSLGP
ncbi:MAG: hypothetical protein HOM34_08740 [Planctomycetes bacterium]|nr:hypothetical protein [Planctomycetota bacterium]MBT7011575.1 hypothetical protein [Planctomycetota bacterium]